MNAQLPKNQPAGQALAEQPLSDVAVMDQAEVRAPLDHVGMAGLALPFRLRDGNLGAVACQGKAQSFVNISQPDIKGIHMSRLYLLLESWAEQHDLTPERLKQLLQAGLDSHQGISDTAALRLDCDYMAQRPALKSEHQGWKAYPLQITVTLSPMAFSTELFLQIPYSSTCPCSASLSRQLLAEAMAEDFAGQAQIDPTELQQWLLGPRGSVATPHSQRSWAQLRLKINTLDHFPISALIDQVETALATPVQTAVKREDEQAFARLNGSNLMFCEDAARRVRQVLLQQQSVDDFWLRVEHQESLHAHDAVAITTRGIEGGYRADLAF